jgi:hypothetical protein
MRRWLITSAVGAILLAFASAANWLGGSRDVDETPIVAPVISTPVPGLTAAAIPLSLEDQIALVRQRIEGLQYLESLGANLGSQIASLQEQLARLLEQQQPEAPAPEPVVFAAAPPPQEPEPAPPTPTPTSAPTPTPVPQMTIEWGASAIDLDCNVQIRLSWTVSGDPNGTVEILRGGNVIHTPTTLAGSYTDPVTVPGSSTLTYQLHATNSAGEAVLSNPKTFETTCIMTFEFNVGPRLITPNPNSTCDVEIDLSWTVGGDPNGTVDLLRNNTVIGTWGVEPQSFTDSFTIVASQEIWEYRLRATNSGGDMPFFSNVITVPITCIP